jgi:hypothetical protein
MKRLKHSSTTTTSGWPTCGPLGDWLIWGKDRIDRDVFWGDVQKVRVCIWERIGNEVGKPVVMTVGRTVPGLYEKHWTR